MADDFWKRCQLVRKISTFKSRHQDRVLSSIKIKNLFNLCKQLHDLNNSRNLRKFQKDVLIYLSEKMYLSNFKDSKYVSELLKLLYKIEGNFYNILVNNAEIWYSSRLKPVGVIKYFLHHSYITNTLFNGCRLPCVSSQFNRTGLYFLVELSVFEGDPLLLHELLRYGALHSHKVNYLKRPKILKRDWNGLRIFLYSISLITKFNPDVLPLTDLSLEDEKAEKYQNHVSCCKLLLRDFPHFYFAVHTPWFRRIINDQYGDRIKMEDMPSFFKTFSNNVAPHLEKHFIEPMELKQSCRHNIRKRLNEKWLLPNAIYDLPLPTILKQYLDLYFD